MYFDYSPKTKEYMERVDAFMQAHVFPNEETYEAQHADIGRWAVPPILEEIKA